MRLTARLPGALIPFLMVLWILAWIDRVNIGFAKLQMLSDLKFSETVYGLGAGIFFLGYFFFEVPSNLLLEKHRRAARRSPASRSCGASACVAMMFVKTPGMFYLLRFLLGVFEAGFYPGVILLPDLLVPDGAPRQGIRPVHVGIRARRRARRPDRRHDHDGMAG